MSSIAVNVDMEKGAVMMIIITIVIIIIITNTTMCIKWCTS